MYEKDAFNLVKKELDHALIKFPQFNSTHEGYAVIQEEIDEFWDDIKLENSQNLQHEAAQIAAMAIRFLTELC